MLHSSPGYDCVCNVLGAPVVSLLPRPIVRRLEQHPTLLNLQRIGAWAIFNLLDGQPRPTIEIATVSMVRRILHQIDLVDHLTREDSLKHTPSYEAVYNRLSE